MEYQIGYVRMVQGYHRKQLMREGWSRRFILVCLENGRRIENWLKIELSGPGMEGSVTFRPTKETFHEALPEPQNASHTAEGILCVPVFSPCTPCH